MQFSNSGDKTRQVIVKITVNCIITQPAGALFMV